MATLFEIIDAFEARHRTGAVAEIVGPFPTRTSLTPRGEVVAAIGRLADMIGCLDAADRAVAHEALCELLDAMADREWTALRADLASRNPEPPIVGRCKVWFQVRPIGAPNIDVFVVYDESDREIERFEAENASLEASDAAGDAARALCAELNARLVTA